MKSKYFGWTVVTVILIALLLYFCIDGVVGRQVGVQKLFPEDAKKAMAGRVKVLMETGYDAGEILNLAMVNGEKEYFAVQTWDENYENQPYRVINLSGETLLETDFFSWGEKKGKYLTGKGEKTWGLLDVEALTVTMTDFTDLTLHDSGAYFAGMRMGDGGKRQFAVAEGSNGKYLIDLRSEEERGSV